MIEIINGDCREVLKTFAPKCVQCCITSPPYFGLRDYGVSGQIGLEPSPDEYVQKLVDVFRQVREVLADNGTLWLNLGDSYAGYHGNKNKEIPSSAVNGWVNGTNENMRTSTANRNGLKQKDLIGIPWRVAFALQADGWYLRSDIIWHKPNPAPESVTDRPTRAHEYMFLLTKSPKYYYDMDAIKEDSLTNSKKNKRSVWTIKTKRFRGAHFAVFPEKLIEPCLLAGSRIDDLILDPFAGSGTVGVVAKQFQRSALLLELNEEYCCLAEQRINN